MKFAENLYWFSLWKPFRSLLFRGYSCNVFAIVQNEEIWLIDVGTDAMFKHKLLIKHMKKDGLDPKNITKIFLTHAHPDHTAALFNFLKISNAEVLIHKLDNDMLEKGYEYFWDKQYEIIGDLRKDFYFFKKKTAMKFSKYPMGDMPHYNSATLLEDGKIIHGDLYSLKTILTPGHTDGHCSFYCPELKALFCGDLIDPGYDHKPPLNFPAVDYDKFNISVSRLKSLDVDYFCAAHAKQIHLGQKFYEEMVEGVIENLEYAKNRVLELLKKNRQMSIKNFRGKFPKKVWQIQEHTSVAYSVLRSLENNGIVRRTGKSFSYVE